MANHPTGMFAASRPNLTKATPWRSWGLLAAVLLAVSAVFIVRTTLAQHGSPPRLFAIFNLAILGLCLPVVTVLARRLRRFDWLLAIGTGALLGAQVTFTHFYPLVELPGRWATSLAHGLALTLAFLAGLAIWRAGGPVRLRVGEYAWGASARSVLFGLAVGLPFALLNVAAFVLLQRQSIHWQSPLSSGLAALQPAIVEEIVYRFAFLGMVWLLFRRSWPRRAVMIAGLVSLLVHSYAHLDDLFRDNPLFALVYGGVLGLLWGLPETLLALRRDLEASIAFHWIQDFLRFFAGF